MLPRRLFFPVIVLLFLLVCAFHLAEAGLI
jgi:hypothetical protein